MMKLTEALHKLQFPSNKTIGPSEREPRFGRGQEGLYHSFQVAFELGVDMIVVLRSPSGSCRQ